jgi:cytochrome c-type biogenesis protein
MKAAALVSHTRSNQWATLAQSKTVCAAVGWPHPLPPAVPIRGNHGPSARIPGMESDPAAGVGVLAALFAGLVSFLSPCVLPLVPGYLSAVTGVSASDLERAGWRRVIAPSLLFVASFSAIFVILGLTATGLGSTLADNRDLLEKVAAAAIIAMGVFFIAALFVTRLNREWHVDPLMQRAGRGGPVVAGAAFAIAWTPCIGPTLAAILSAAALSDSAAHGAFLLAVYSAGLAIPFLLTAIAFTRMTTAFDAVKRHYPAIMAAGGAVLIAMGVLIWTGEFFRLNAESQELMRDLNLDFVFEV